MSEEHIKTLRANKMLCTGASLYDGPIPEFTLLASTQEAFDSVVTTYYKFFRESITADVAFLQSVGRSRDSLTFNSDIYLLRTAKQHDDNPKATAFYALWKQKNDTWQKAADALTQALINALGELAQISNSVRKNQNLTAAWRDRASISPETIFESVCRDLNVNYPFPVKQGYLSTVKRRVKRLRPNEDVKRSIEDFCTQVITSESDLLPVPYQSILDRLGLLGKSNARAALLLAYSLGSSSSLQGEDFLIRLEKAWKIVDS